jgi:predicted phosphoadenosine phosphosulfate sulfurtransferase
MRQKVYNFISTWENRGYKQGIPDEADPKIEAMGLAPSYRRICRAILTNDLALTSLGFSKEKTEAYSLLKKIELEKRAKNERTRGRKKKT